MDKAATHPESGDLNKISAVIITFNEEEKIRRALDSLCEVADEIIVVDSFSTDDTERICREFTDQFLQRPWPGYREQKQFATDQAAFDWVLSLDADEVVGPQLRSELMEWKKRLIEHDGYFLPRRTFFMGRWIEHTTWYPDHQLRLFRKSRGSWQGRRVHESFRVQGTTGRFQGALEHYTYSSISEYLKQLETFTTLAAQDAFDHGRRSGLLRLTLYPAVTFLNNFFIRRGFLDGLPGLTVSILSSVSVYFKYLKLWELQSEGPKGPTASTQPSS